MVHKLKLAVVALLLALPAAGVGLVATTEIAAAYPTKCGNAGTDYYDDLFDCFNPNSYCRPYGGYARFATLYYQGFSVGSFALGYSGGSCRTAWSEGYAFTNSYTHYYTWVNRTGAPGDTWGYAVAWNGSAMWSAQLNDRNPRKAIAWMTYKPTANIYCCPALGPTYGNTYPPY